MTTTKHMTKVAGEFCPLCGERGRLVAQKDGVALRACCGSLLAWAWNSEAEYEGLYTESSRYHEGEQMAEGQRTFWERDSDRMQADSIRLRTLGALFGPLRGRKLIDIGASTGAFASLARHTHGMDARGIEPNPGMVAQGMTLGRPVEVGTWQSIEGGADFITLHDVFEHLTRPHECLDTVYAVLNPGGVLVIEMPEWNSPDQQAAGLGWKHIRPRQHLCLYSRESAESLYAAHGFTVASFVRPLAGKLGKMAHYLIKET
jgi:SAM-dependent methyltransferase